MWGRIRAGSNTPNICELVKKYHLEGSVAFYGQTSDVSALMMVSNVVLSTAIEPEAFGRISIEGQAMAKVVVASNIGGSLDTITDGVTGKFFYSNNPASLAEAIDWALDLSPDEVRKIAKAGIKPKVPAANMVTILESPSLAPGGIIGRGGIRFSKAESTIAKAPSTARVVNRRVFFLISAMVFLLMGRDASNKVFVNRMFAVRIP